MPIGLAGALAVGFVQLRDVRLEPRTFLLMAATFLGVLWILAVAEEFFFRGVIQQFLARLLGSDRAGLAIASVIFGLAHLGYREFPNWRFALLATVAGVFYGRAYLQAQSIRAAMVTHALVVTVWKTFLT
jgi:membrane protease YdiL (CAAX protease family)